MDNIQILFNKYQEKYPLYRVDALVDKMLDDGVISFEDAKNLREGKSVFNIGKNNFSTLDDNISATEIMGGVFSISKTSKTNFNKKIEPTKQPFTSGACWLLSDINSLNETAWGKKAIEDAIIPDTDDKGGVTINFKGSPLEQKDFYISKKDIINAKKSGLYSSGDDDMLAFELATEKCFKEMIKQGLGIRANSDKDLEELGFKYRQYINGGISSEKYYQYPISKLLGLESEEINFQIMNGYNSAKCLKDRDIVLRKIAENKENLSMYSSFSPDTKNEYVHGGHAYAVKVMKYNEYVVLNDPHYPESEIKMPWKDFVGNITDLLCSTNNKTILSKINRTMPPYYKETKEEFDERFKKF